MGDLNFWMVPELATESDYGVHPGRCGALSLGFRGGEVCYAAVRAASPSPGYR